MSEIKESIENKIFQIRKEFINFLISDLEKRADGIFDRIGVRNSVYKFILNKVVNKKVKKEKREKFIKFFIRTVDFCLSFGDVILDVLVDLKKSQEFFEKLKKDDSEIDA